MKKITKKIALLVKDTDQKIILIRENINNSGIKFNLIKGTHEGKDQTLQDTITREAYEEAGLDLESYENKKMRILDVIHLEREEYISCLTVVEVVLGEKNIVLSTQFQNSDENIVSADWYSQDFIKQLEENDFVNSRILGNYKKMSLIYTRCILNLSSNKLHLNKQKNLLNL